MIVKTNAINGEIECFSVVIAIGDSDYPYFVGEVNAVDKPGSYEHDGESDTDDVLVDFRSEEYSEQRIKEIEAHFSKRYGEPKRFEQLENELFNAKIKPDKLIRIKNETTDLPALLESREAAKAYCDDVLSRVKKMAFTLNGIIEVGDWVLSSPDEDYACLVGQVTAIDKLGTPEHDTENETDDIHVDFSGANYSEQRAFEIEKDFSSLYGEQKVFADLPLDDAIMAPDMLVRLPGAEFDRLGEILSSSLLAERWIENTLDKHYAGVEEQLVERVRHNHADFLHSLKDFGTNELIDMAHKIAAMSDACEYMTSSHGYEKQELWFYMQLQNPLEVVADAWLERNNDISDLSFTMDYVFEHNKTNLVKYPLITDKSEAAVIAPAPAPPTKKKSIEEQLRKGKEKVEAYKAEQAAAPTTKKHNEERN